MKIRRLAGGYKITDDYGERTLVGLNCQESSSPDHPLTASALTLALKIFLGHDSPMIATLGEAHDLGWKLTVYCRFGKREGMKAIRECTGRAEMDLETVVWTRGRDFPITRLDSRMKCPRCGSRKVLVAFEAPPRETQMRA